MHTTVRSRIRSLLPGILLAAGTHVAAPASAGDFTHYESSHVHPLALSPTGDRLFAVNTPEARVAFFDIDAAGGLRFAGDVPVGLEPVSLAVRPDGSQVWVANHLSDTISVVDVATRRLVATIAVGDEPTDVVFASGRAFVSLAGKEDRVAVVDAQTRELVVRIDIFGDDPRALSASPDGTRVAVVVLESGNQTINLHPNHVRSGGGPPPPDPPRRLPFPAPEEGLIIQFDPATGEWRDEEGANWSAFVPFGLPDRDLFWIDAAAALPDVVAYTSGVGTTLFDVAIHPTRGDAWVPNTDARNLVRFEPNLRGHLVETRITVVSPDGGVAFIDLNPHIDYGVSPGSPEERLQSLAQPGQGIFDRAGERYYLTAFGSARVAVLDTASGAVVERIAVPGGPSGLALHEAAHRLYVMSRFDNAVASIDLDAGVQVASIGVAGPRGFDPSPPEVRNGRHLLYDARESSGHGDLSCATCHLFANFDGLAWDLGDPEGGFLRYDEADWVTFFPAPSPRVGFDPMKGPITTQTLRGLRGTEPFHWRGDRRNFQAFNGAFVSLLGREMPISEAEMEAFNAFIMTVEFPPNPNRNLDDTLPAALDTSGEFPGDPRNGERIFFEVPQPSSRFKCTVCHGFPGGTPNTLSFGAGSQDTKIPQLRSIYEKVSFDPRRLDEALLTNEGAFEQKGSVGVLHEGALSLVEFLTFGARFGPADTQDLAAFLQAFPTGTFPCVGRQLTLDGAEGLDGSAVLATLREEARAGHCDLIAKGVIGDVDAGFVYAAAADAFVSDSALDPIPLERFGPGDLLTFTGVPPGNGLRLGIDRDRDSCLDRDEVAKGSDPANPGLLRDDSDDDGIPDEIDRCPGWRQSDRAQTDSDGNGRPDACECGDVDGDGQLTRRDLQRLAFWLLGLPSARFDVAMCNVRGAPGTSRRHCTIGDFRALQAAVNRPARRETLLRQACRPQTALPQPTPRICFDAPAAPAIL